MEALEKAQDEVYHPQSQSFTTQEDVAMLREIEDDDDDDSLDFVDFSTIKPIKNDPIQKPVNDPHTQKLFDFSGSGDSVSTLAHDQLSVTVQDDVSQQNDETSLPIDENASASSKGSATTQKTATSTTSIGKRITTIEQNNLQTSQDIAQLRKTMNAFMTSLNPNFVPPEATDQQDQASGET